VEDSEKEREKEIKRRMADDPEIKGE